MRGGLRKANTLANAQRQIRVKTSTMADCARVDAMVVLRRENLQRGICDGGSAKGKCATENLRRGNVLRTTDGKRSNVGSDCSKTNF